MIFFKSSPVVVEQLFRNFASIDMTFQEFKDLCKLSWEDKYSYLIVDLSRDFKSGNKYHSMLELI